MKYYSEKLSKLFDTEKELKEAEKIHSEKEEAAKKAEAQRQEEAKKIAEERKIAAKEVEDAYKAADEARKAADKKLQEFLDKYKVFHCSYSSIPNRLDLFDIFDRFFF